MRQSRLRVKEEPSDLIRVGHQTMGTLIPPQSDPDNYFPQYVPSKEKAAEPAFTVVWEAKVREFRDIPRAVKADPPPLSTGIFFAHNDQDLADPYRVAQAAGRRSRQRDSVRGGMYAQLMAVCVHFAQVWKLTNLSHAVRASIGSTCSAHMESRKGGCVHRIAK